MGRNQSPAEDLLKQVIAGGVTAVLKPAGFRKSGMNFHRRRGTTVQVVNVQVSHGSTSEKKTFYVNVGIAFDAICALIGRPVSDSPKEYECHDLGTQDRLDALVGRKDGEWSIRADENPAEISSRLRQSIDELRGELDLIDGPAAYRAHRWFNRFRPVRENAQILYVLGDLDGAWNEVTALAKHFEDRINANRPGWWVDQLGLSKLKSRVK